MFHWMIWLRAEMGGEGEEAGDKEAEAEVMAKGWLVVHGVGVVLAPSVEGD